MLSKIHSTLSRVFVTLSSTHALIHGSLQPWYHVPTGVAMHLQTCHFAAHPEHLLSERWQQAQTFHLFLRSMVIDKSPSSLLTYFCIYSSSITGAPILAQVHAPPIPLLPKRGVSHSHNFHYCSYGFQPLHTLIHAVYLASCPCGSSHGYVCTPVPETPGSTSCECDSLERACPGPSSSGTDCSPASVQSASVKVHGNTK